MQEKIEYHLSVLNKLINSSSHISVITGAGISTSCGIPDFRGPKGLYSRNDIDAGKLFDLQYFKKDPMYFYNTFRSLFEDCLNANPSPGHWFIKKLEMSGKLEILVTQNIDGLHEKTGISNIIRAHGCFDKLTCLYCNYIVISSKNHINKILSGDAPVCPDCGNILKPDIVFFGEPVKGMTESIFSIENSDLILAMGTSLSIYPVAQLPEYKKSSTPLVIINQGITGYDNTADLKLDMPINEVVEKLNFH